MKSLLGKNLQSHKPRNFLTSIIYSLTLGCIIFLLVTASLNLQTINNATTYTSSDILVNYDLDPSVTDDILREYQDSILDFGYLAYSLHYY